MNKNTLQEMFHLARVFPALTANDYIRLSRLAKRHRRICENQCNGIGLGGPGVTAAMADTKEADYGRQLAALLEKYTIIAVGLAGSVQVHSQHDPRGCTLYLSTSTGNPKVTRNYYL